MQQVRRKAMNRMSTKEDRPVRSQNRSRARETRCCRRTRMKCAI